MGETVRIPRIVVTGLASGVGKTTVVIGLAAALRARGMRVVTFKCGPDYLDPTYHARATGAPSHNLDGWMMGRDAVLRTLARASAGVDIAIVEGVMGLFDGASATDESGSTAEIAKWIDAPVAVVVDASGMARTIAAIAQGMASFDPAVRIAGIVANRVGSRGHLDLLRKAQRSPPVLGGLPVDAAHAFPERHLGLVTADEERVPPALVDHWAAVASEWIALDALVDAARSAPPLAVPSDPSVTPVGSCHIGIVSDDALHFYYDDNLRALEAHGATLVRFSILRDERIPDVDGLYLGGGYPEAHAGAIASNETMCESIRAFAGAGGPVYAECGGLMVLARSLRTLDGRDHAMCGVLPLAIAMRDKLQALGYCEVETQAPTILGDAGLRFRGHQFRYSEIVDSPAGAPAAYAARKRRTGEVVREGWTHGRVLASYVHAHWASNPLVARGFVASCAAFARGRP